MNHRLPISHKRDPAAGVKVSTKRFLARGVVLFASLLFLSNSATAHLFYLDLRSPVAQSTKSQNQDNLVVDVRVGHAFRGELLPRMDHHIQRFELIRSDGQRFSLTGIDGRAPAGVVRDVLGQESGSGALGTVLYESHGVTHTMDREKFESYAREEGIHHLLESRAPAAGGVEEETYHRCAKLVVATGAEAPSSLNDLASAETGCTLEIVSAGLDRRGDVVEARFRLLLRGEPLSLALVRASTSRDSEHTARSDEDGTVAFDLTTESQSWLISAVHLEASNQSPGWRSWWSTLSMPAPNLEMGRAPSGSTDTTATTPAESEAN